MRRVWVILMLGVLLTPRPLSAQQDALPRDEAGERAIALGVSAALVSGAVQRAAQAPQERQQAMAEQIEAQAAIEAQLGLQLYQLGEDWRAISAMQRYQLLARDRRAAYLSGLIIGQIYARNTRPALAAESFEQATLAAPSLEARAWSYLLHAQQICLGLDYWVECRWRLDALHEEREGELSLQVSEVMAMQRAVAAVMLRQPTPAISERVRATARFQERLARLELERERFLRLPRRRPWLAAGMSAVVPGAGQLYNRQWGDALIAFGLNALFAGATYHAFVKLESVPLGVGSALLLSGFYVGNIVNAHGDASRHNALMYQHYFEGVKREHWPRVTFAIDRGEVSYGVEEDEPEDH